MKTILFRYTVLFFSQFSAVAGFSAASAELMELFSSGISRAFLRLSFKFLLVALNICWIIWAAKGIIRHRIIAGASSGLLLIVLMTAIIRLGIYDRNPMVSLISIFILQVMLFEILYALKFIVREKSFLGRR